MAQEVADAINSLLLDWGMPDEEWWRQADIAYTRCHQILTNNINPRHDTRRPGEPIVSVLPNGNFACHLSARGDELEVVAVGSIRKSLYVDVVWQNILELQDNGTPIKVFQMSEKRISFEVQSFLFNVRYIECEELVRNFPDVQDAPEDFVSEIQVEAGELVETLQSLSICKKSVLENWQHRALFYFLSSWTGLVGLKGNKLGIIDANGIRDLSWDILVSEGEAGIVFVLLSFLDSHQICRWSSAESCTFHGTRLEMVAKSWSSNQFRYFHQEMKKLAEGLRHQTQSHFSVDSPLSASPNASDEISPLVEYLSLVASLPIVKRIESKTWIQVSLIYSGQSQLGGSAMMKFVQDKVIVLVEKLEKASVDIFVRPWPRPLTDETIKGDHMAYEGCWLIGLSSNCDNSLPENDVRDALAQWNGSISQSSRYSRATMDIHAEIQSELELFHQRDDNRQWPRPIIEPEPSSRNETAVGNTAKKVEKPKIISGAPGKLRPALDVLSRLKYDAQFDLDDYMVGYMDRHSGIMEKPAANWIQEVSEEEWIPQSRIQHFRRVSDNCVVWDRASKKDLVFRQ